jgi:hypothetical protein
VGPGRAGSCTWNSGRWIDLLGLQVHLDRVVLDITAQSGPGNLLGNLLCSIANALNGGAPANVLANLLNQLLAILG